MGKSFKSILCGAAAVALVVAASGQAMAASVGSLIQNGPNSFSDEDREYLIDNVFTVVGQVDVGDSLRGAINISTLNSAGANVGGTTGNHELSGIYQVLVTGKLPVGPGLFTFTYSWDPAFAVAPLPGLPGGPGPGAIAVLYDDPTNNFAGDFDDPAPAAPPAGPDDGAAPQTVPPSSADVSVGPYVTEEAFIATATNGAHFLTLGFLGLPGEGGSGLTLLPGFDNVLAAFGMTSGTSGGVANFGLNVLAYGPAWPGWTTINRVTPSPFGGPVDIALNQNIKGVFDLDTPFEISTDTTGSFNATVPEPGSMTLLGIGLLGLSAYGRRRAKKS